MSAEHREDDIPLGDRYIFRYRGAEISRDKTLEGMSREVPPKIQRTYQDLIDLQEEGVDISHPDFVARNVDAIVSTLPMFRVGLRRMHARTLFTTFIDGLDPENRTPSSIPVPESRFLTTTTEEDPLRLINMYSQANNEALHAELIGFEIDEAVIPFLGALQDSTPLLPSLAPGIAHLWGDPKREADGSIVIRAQTKFAGVEVVYRPYPEQRGPGLPQTALLVSPLK